MVSTTAGSSVRMFSSGMPPSRMALQITTVMTEDKIMPCRMHSFTRSCRPAPMFCPIKLVIAAPIALLTAQKMPSALLVMAQEATTTVPREFTPICTIMFETAYMDDCIPEGMPRRIMFLRYTPFKRRLRSESRYGCFVRIRRSVSSAILMICASTVAMATPATPQPKKTTKTKSIMMFDTHPATMNRNGPNESPTARSMFDSMFSTRTKGTPAK